MTIDPTIAMRLQFLGQSGHDAVPMLEGAANKLVSEVERRGWI